jgi:hypothetical protein
MAVGRIIVDTPAEALVAVHRQGRVLRPAHAARRGQLFGTLIHHARRCPFAQAKRAIAISIVGSSLWRLLVPSARGALLGRASHYAARVVAVTVASEAGPAHREQIIATTASLKAKRELGVHRPAVETPTNLPTSSASSIVSSKPVSVG